MREAEACADDEGPDLPAWQEREWELVRKIVFSDRFKRLPNKFDIHEWAIMDQFAHEVRSDRVGEELLDAIRGAGAFRSFQATIRRHRIEQVWYKFRAAALRQIGIHWCKRNHIPWE